MPVARRAATGTDADLWGPVMRRPPLLPAASLAAALALGVVLLHPLSRGAHAEAGTCAAAARPAPLQMLRAQNGLYYVPGLRQQQAPDLRDSAYGLAALHALGIPTPVQLHASDVRSLVATDISGSAVWSRWYLLQVQQASGQRLLQEQDASALRTLVGVDGAVTDASLPAGPGHDVERLATTAAAVDVLAAVDPGVLAGMATTRRWLQELRLPAPVHPFVAALRQGALRRFGADDGLAAAVQGAEDWFSGLRSRGESDLNGVSHDLYGYVALLRLARRPVAPEAAAFFEPVLRAAATVPDVQVVYYAAAAARALDAPPAATDGLVSRLRGSLSPEGLVREQVTLIGTVDATEAVDQLMGAWGYDTCDRTQSAALVALKHDQWEHWDAVTRGRWVIAAKASGDPAWDTPRREALSDLLAALPSRVGPENYARWATTGDLVQRLGGRVPVPTVDRWSVQDRLGAQAAAAVVSTMVQAGLAADVPAWLRQVDLLALMRSDSVARTTLEQLLLLNAHLHLSGHLDEQGRVSVKHLVGASKGCLDLPELMRASPSDTVCDLRTSLAMQQLATLDPSLHLSTAE